jgi:hypothetical protein
MKTARESILIEGLDDWVDLGRIHRNVAQASPSLSLSEVQQKTLDTIRSLVSDGLFELGDLSGKGGHFVSWQASLEDSMKIIYDVYITHFDDRDLWYWYCWLNLTTKGEQVAEPLERRYAEVRSDS